jgi:hypothetical protein
VPEPGLACATQFRGHPDEPPAAAPPTGALEAGHDISMLRDQVLVSWSASCECVQK